MRESDSRKKIRDGLARRLTLKKRVKAFFSWVFVIFLFVFLNGYAYFSSHYLSRVFTYMSWEDALEDSPEILGCLIALVAAAGFDAILFVGMCRRSILPQVSIELCKETAELGDAIDVSYQIIGARGWVNKITAEFTCVEIDDDVRIKTKFREIVFCSVVMNELEAGSFSLVVPVGFPATGWKQEEKTVIMWGIEITGRTVYGLLPNIKGFAELSVREECA